MGRRRVEEPELTGAAAEAYASTSRRLGLGLMLSVLLAAPAISASLSGDMGSRDLAVRSFAALVVGRLAVELIARVVNPRPASATADARVADHHGGAGLPGAVGDSR